MVDHIQLLDATYTSTCSAAGRDRGIDLLVFSRRIKVPVQRARRNDIYMQQEMANRGCRIRAGELSRYGPPSPSPSSERFDVCWSIIGELHATHLCVVAWEYFAWANPNQLFIPRDPFLQMDTVASASASTGRQVELHGDFAAVQVEWHELFHVVLRADAVRQQSAR